MPVAGKISRKLLGSVAALLLVAAGAAIYFRHSRPAPVAPPIAPSPTAGSLLDEMKDSAPAATKSSGAVPTNQQLEKQVALIHQNQEQVNALKIASTRAMRADDGERVKTLAAEGQRQFALLNLRLSALQADLDAARSARPKDPAVEWLTGELLLIAGGEPAEIRPYFEHALAAGVHQPQLLTSMAAIELDSNHFEAAYDYARQAVAADAHSETVWDAYLRASFAVGRFAEAVERIDRTFPGVKPPWAVLMRDRAQRLKDQWQRELALRRADKHLPVVRLTIEHRAFAQQGAEKSTGRGEVEIALFQDQAPLAVANFLKLVERKFYDGTRFHWAEAGRMVVGGDPNTKGENRAGDGRGGPGYFIPDESRAPAARAHFRGSVAMFQPAPGSAGSQFVIDLVPAPELNGHFTVFGRVIDGQQVVDQITAGRTNRSVGDFGKIIPGDVLVRAEVVRNATP